MLSFDECFNEIIQKKSFEYRTDTYNYIVSLFEKEHLKKVLHLSPCRNVCPVCEHTLLKYQNYCPNCGQHLDWS